MGGAGVGPWWGRRPAVQAVTVGHSRNAGLDGLRGIAVLLVVLGHAAGAFRSAEDDGRSKSLAVVFNGGLGVIIFFVLSGYLITSILMRERARTGRISLPDFYLRRAFRILPAFYVFLAVVSALALTHVVDVGAPELASAGLFLHDYWSAGNSWWLGHTWSLAVEEQFYLLWPLALIWMRPRTASRIALGYLLVAPVLRVASYVLWPASRDHVWEMFHTRADSLLVGCLLALVPVTHPAVYERLRRLAQRPVLPVLAVALLVVSSALDVAFGGRWSFPAGYTLMSVAAGSLVLVVVAREGGSRLQRALAWRPVVTVGLISYSLYLWQQLFLPQVETAGPSKLGEILLRVALALATATISYLLVEKPFLRLKDRVQDRRASSSTPADLVSGDREPPL
jgi:peptidoglycan/LPS O-acetylase OafA/YrhL